MKLFQASALAVTAVIAATSLVACSQNASSSSSASPTGSVSPTAKNTAPVQQLSFKSVDSKDDVIMPTIPDLCNGNTSVNPVLVSNSTGSAQSVSVGVQSALARELQFASEPPSNTGCMPEGSAQNITGQVAAGQTAVFYITAGGANYNTTGSGGEYGNIGLTGSDWYQIDLHLNINDGFDSLSLDANHQSSGPNTGGLALVGCSPSSAGASSYSTVPSDVISNGSNPNGTASWSKNQPICFNIS